MHGQETFFEGELEELVAEYAGMYLTFEEALTAQHAAACRERADGFQWQMFQKFANRLIQEYPEALNNHPP